MVSSGTNRADYLIGFGGRENELYVFGGFFHDLQQGVKSLLSDHMGFI